MKKYRLASLKADASAGLTVALVLVPQSMANAQLAGLPAYHGIYAALLPALIGGIWGSSRHMVTGTVAVTSLMAGAALQPLAISGPGGYIAYMTLLTLLVGLIQLAFGIARMGIVVSFLSSPVIAGFTNAAAIIIASSQLAKLFGVAVDSSPYQYETVLNVLRSALYYSHMPSLGMAALALGIIWVVQRFIPRLPAVLAAVVVTTSLSWLVGFESKTTATIHQLHSDEANLFIIRYNQQTLEMDKILKEIHRLEGLSTGHRVTQLEIEYKINEQKLFQERIGANLELTREHLRRMLFVAEKKEDGSREFYLKRSPQQIDGLLDYDRTKGGGAQTEGSPADLQARVAAIPADSFQDGKTWRLAVGSGMLDLKALHMFSGGAVVGAIPAGLPQFTLPEFVPEHLVLLLSQALIIAFLGFAESISIGKAAAHKFGYRVDANQELVGQGLANVAGAFTLTSPVSGSFSSSAVNISAGAHTGVSCAFAALGALVTLLFFTAPLYFMPQSVLAVIVIRAVGKLIHLEEFRRVWTAQWHDGVVAFVTFASTLYFAPHLDYGIGIGVALSLVFFFYRAMRPRIVTLSCGPDNALRDVKVFGLDECRHIAIVHFQGPLFFANAEVLEDHICWRIENQRDLQHIHLVCTGITHIDASGEEVLSHLVDRAHTSGIGISFSGVIGAVAEVMARTGIIRKVGWENVFLTPREAICHIHKRVQHDVGCTECPLSEIFCRKREMEESYRPLSPFGQEGLPVPEGEGAGKTP